MSGLNCIQEANYENAPYFFFFVLALFFFLLAHPDILFVPCCACLLGVVPTYLVALVIENHKKPNPIAKVRLFEGFLILVDVDENELEACRGQSTCQMYWFTARCVNRH